MKALTLLAMALSVGAASNWPFRPVPDARRPRSPRAHSGERHGRVPAYGGGHQERAVAQHIRAVGLRNYGGTCFFNSLIQALFSQPDFRHLILNTDLSAVPKQTSRELMLLRRIKRLFGAMDTGNFGKVDVYTAICSVYDYEGQPVFVGRQEDVHLYFGYLITMLERAWTQLPGVRPNALVETILGSRGHYSEGGDVISFVENSLYNLNPITVDVDKGLFGTALKTAFISRVDDLWRGQRNVRGVVETQVGTVPRHLIIQLRRMYRDANGNQEKLNNAFKFPMNFKLGDHVALQGDNDSYTLRAVILHVGKAACGHYTTVVRRGREWLLFDDDRVHAISENDMKWYAFGYGTDHRNAYMLFYDRD